MLTRITADNAADPLTIHGVGGLTASTTSRTLSGMAVLYGVPGRTSAGRLRVRPGALRFPEDVTRVKLTEEHDRAKSRGFIQSLQFLPEGIRASAKVANGPEGDKALAEADPENPIRDGFSFDVVDWTIQGDELIDAEVVAIGQVGIPAYDDTRIDSIAASQISNATLNPGETMLTEAQKTRLAELAALTDLTDAQKAELAQLNVLNAASTQTAAADAATSGTSAAASTAEPQPVTASAATTGTATAPAGAPAPITAGSTGSSGVEVNESPLNSLVSMITGLLRGDRSQSITAALSDVTSAQHSDNVSEDSWSGELWSGLEYQPEFLDLFVDKPLTSFDGKGWRWGVKPQVGDYAGNKADIPSNVPTTIPSTWAAFRIAGGWDIDRKFFDFPDSAFIASFVAAVREDIALKRDLKVRDYILAQAVDSGVAAQATLMKAARQATKIVKRNTKQKATFVLINDDDYDDLFDITADDVPAYADLLGVKPEDFRSSPDVTQGLVIAGVKQAAVVRWLGGASPIRVQAENLTKAGIDEAFFTYGAIEEHHTTGIVKQTYTPA